MLCLLRKKFRGRGNKRAALAAMQELEAAGLGKLESTESRRGTSAVCCCVDCLKCSVKSSIHSKIETYIYSIHVHCISVV